MPDDPSESELRAKLVTVASFVTAWEAHLARNKLDAAGIMAAVLNEPIDALGLGTVGTPPVDVQVRAADLDAAREILARKGEHPEQEIDEPRCPVCNAPATPARSPMWLVLISFPLLGIPWAMAPDYWRCTVCRRRFVTEDRVNEQDRKDRALREEIDRRRIAES